jgi:amidase
MADRGPRAAAAGADYRIPGRGHRFGVEPAMKDNLRLSRRRQNSLNRREFLQQSLLGGAATLIGGSIGAQLPAGAATRAENFSEKFTEKFTDKNFELNEIPIGELQNGMKAGKYSAQAIAEKYLARIKELDRAGANLHAVIELNPDALAIAKSLDRERKEKGARGPLHGIPVLIKDNIDTADKMATSAGSLALAGSIAPRDAFIVERLRAAGAVILGKTNLSEWANFRSIHASSGWSGRGGQCRNPYVLDHSPSGSSSGSGAAVAANLVTVAIGAETDGSIVSPSSSNSLVGIKPTLGLVSRAGIIPIAHSQDTAGPMARTVRDAAILLSVIAGVDARDSATQASANRAQKDYTQFLDAQGLRGARIGVARNFWGFNGNVDRLMNERLEDLKRLGAELIDPANIETIGKFDDSELEVLLFEFKADLNAYLAGLSNKITTRTLKDLIEFNERNRSSEMAYFDQEIFLMAEAKGHSRQKIIKMRLRKTCASLAPKGSMP